MARFERIHGWDVSPTQAVALQQQLRSQVRLQPAPGPFRTVAGADISFDLGSETVYAGIVVLSLPELETIEEVGVTTRAPFPYVPGLLTFREAPALLEAWAQLRCEPDAVMLDGQGVAHPRRIGIASHLGLFLQRPTVGCGKSRLVGRFAEPGSERGDWSPLVDKGECVGAALRSKRRTQPLFISPGHLLDLPGALALTLACGGGYRVPEPTRRAHLFVNALRRAGQAPHSVVDGHA
ncbi:deoxyribonuclease V [Aggregicoccus sp. 17bor-14]|uniref:deoxyribonuclease V n=1 Tax=Myxococcaceae TaxID=31 RepID=UPI00129CD722|nr:MULTISPECIES: deoxyribonuclease V [Myxococcaceae]MBF5040774.1 deoxyribonuclease V [Simulacricoccus sp. 17bor-14]MRI86562.1 deoxyribonuclease V [Aggregicoccus sp. 17bor-14]